MAESGIDAMRKRLTQNRGRSAGPLAVNIFPPQSADSKAFFAPEFLLIRRNDGFESV